MRISIKLFMKSSEYRKICLQGAKYGFLNAVTKPINRVKSKVMTKKFMKEFPDNWSRYVEMKRLEGENERKERLFQLTECRMEITHHLTMMHILMLKYIAKTDSTFDVEKANGISLEEVEKQFLDDKKKTIISIEKCKELGAFLPEELLEIVKKSNYDSYHSIQELRLFTEQTEELMEMFDFGEIDG